MPAQIYNIPKAIYNSKALPFKRGIKTIPFSAPLRHEYLPRSEAIQLFKTYQNGNFTGLLQRGTLKFLDQNKILLSLPTGVRKDCQIGMLMDLETMALGPSGAIPNPYEGKLGLFHWCLHLDVFLQLNLVQGYQGKRISPSTLQKLYSSLDKSEKMLSALGWQEKREYLGKKLVEGAKLLEEYFDKLVQDNSLSPKSYAPNLIPKYELTENQETYFKKIAAVLEGAHFIIDWLAHVYGEENGYIIEKNKLYRALFNRRPPKNFKIKRYNFGFGIYTQNIRHKKGAIGYQYIHNLHKPSSLAYIIDKTRNKILSKTLDKEKLSSLKELSFRIGMDEIKKEVESVAEYEIEKGNLSLSPEERLLKAIFGPPDSIKDINKKIEKVKEMVKRHELKHVFEDCIGYNRMIGGAHLFAGLEDFARTTQFIVYRFYLKYFIDGVEYYEKRYKRLKEVGAPEIILSNELARLKDLKTELSKARKVAKLIEKILKSGKISGSTLSFIMLRKILLLRD